MSSKEINSYIIVGSGVFGASTAYYLSKAHPEASIVLIDRSSSFPCPLAASHDFNKIIRADYGDSFYCKLALEARKVWKSDPLYMSFYHETGMVVLEDTGLGRRIIRNYEDLKVDHSACLVEPTELKGRYGSMFEDTDYQNVKEVFINPSSGWAEATPAVRSVIEASVAQGVEYVQGDVESIILNDKGECAGIRTKDGRLIHADRVILSTGAGTAKLLAKSAPHREDLQSGDRITAAAVITGIVKLREEHRSRFAESPSFIHNMDHVFGIDYFGLWISTADSPDRSDFTPYT